MANSPSYKCLPYGPTRGLQSTNPFQILQTPDLVAIITEHIDYRMIYTDGRSHPEDILDYPEWMGHSIGKWEGDTLVVDTKYFVGHHHWIDSGIPASEDLHIVERMKLVNNGQTLEIEYTFEDPKSYEGQWKTTKRWQRTDDRDIAEVSCLPDLNDHMPSTHSGDNVK